MKRPYCNAALLFLPALFTLFNSARGYGTCVNLTIPVTITAQAFTLEVPPFKNNFESTSFINQVTRRGASGSPITGKTNFTATYSIDATYCTPTVRNPECDTLQILTHGLGFDKNYWDFILVPGNYSYVAAALRAGFSTFAYSRLGTGLSAKPNPYTTINSPTELAILAQLTRLLRSSSLPNTPTPHTHYTHTGHSYGSMLSNALVALDPSASDGLVLTGYSNNFAFEGLFLATTGHLASLNQPRRFGGHSSGFITWADVFCNQYSFLSFPFFDPAVAAAAEATKWPFTVGEIVSEPVLAAPEYKGPVLFLNGQFDLIFCGGNCTNIVVDGPTSISRSEIFPAASAFEVYVQPRAGHAVNLHFNSTGAYGVAFAFLKRHGLG
ncbi:hypothetical protein MMC12_007149 [Toensbergia leucococca]|nr:hypothetical protein [Toensbergia leucococca]